MTKIVSLNEISIQTVIALAHNGDEIIIEENGEPLVKITSVAKPTMKQRVLGLGAEKEYFMSDDFDDELSDEFWGWNR